MADELASFVGVIDRAWLEGDTLRLRLWRGSRLDLEAENPIVTMSITGVAAPEPVLQAVATLAGEEIDGVEIARVGDGVVVTLELCFANDGQSFEIRGREASCTSEGYAAEDYRQTIRGLLESSRKQAQEHYALSTRVRASAAFLRNQSERIQRKIAFFAERSPAKAAAYARQLELVRATLATLCPGDGCSSGGGARSGS